MVDSMKYRELRKRLIDRGMSISDWIEEQIDHELAREKGGDAA